MATSSPIIGHEQIIAFLSDRAKAGKTEHAYLFLGPENCGKRTTALFFIKLLRCQNLTKNAPCEHCMTCRGVEEGSDPDFRELVRTHDEKTKKIRRNISLEQIQETQEFLCQKSWSNLQKVLLISDAETLSDKAANALLKTLEEPKGNPLIIVLANHAKNLPLTIASRCQKIHFAPVDPQSIETALATRYDPMKAHDAAQLAFGRPGRAVEFLAHPEQAQEYQKISLALLLQRRFPLHKQLKELVGLLPFLTRQDEEKTEKTLAILEQWRVIFRDLLLAKFSCTYLMAHGFIRTETDDLAKSWTPNQIIRALDGIKKAKKNLRANVSSKTILENFIIENSI